MGDYVATFVTLRAAGFTLRETLGPVVARCIELGRIARKPRGTDGSHAVLGDLSSSLPRGTERPIGRDFAPKENGYSTDRTKEPRWPGGPWWDGRPRGHRFCADAVVSYYGKGTPGRCLGSSGIPPVAPPHGPGAIEMRLARGGQGGVSTRCRKWQRTTCLRLFNLEQSNPRTLERSYLHPSSSGNRLT